MISEEAEGVAEILAAADGRWTVDVVIDRLAMSHTIDLKDRLATTDIA
jgi:hypothetical protein